MKQTRWLLYAVFGLVFYLLFLIVQTPASWLAWGLNRYTQGAVRLDPVAGSLWSGSGRLVVYYPQTTPHDFGRTEWRVNPLWLAAGRAQLSLQSDHADRRVRTTLGLERGGLMITDTDAEFSAAFVAQLYAPLSLISPRGKVRISTDNLALTPDKVDGTAALEWLDAGSGLASVQPLGDYRLDVTGAEKNVNLRLSTLRGDLEFSGQGMWQPRTGQLRLNGSAVPRARAAELEPLLGMMGPDQGGGRRALVLNIALPAR